MASLDGLKAAQSAPGKAAADLHALLLIQGASIPEADMLAAIAMAESYSAGLFAARGDLGLVNAKWGPSIGAWQIRTLNAERGKGTYRDELKLTGNATWQAKAALHIKRNEGGYQAWTVYKTGAYGEWLQLVQKSRDGTQNAEDGASTGVGGQLAGTVGDIGGKVVDAGSGVLGGLDAIGAFFGALGQRSTWVRVLQVGGGSVAIVIGLTLLGKDIARPALNAAAGLNPVTRTAKTAADIAAAAKG